MFGGIKTGGDINDDNAITRFNNFQTFPAAALLLFRLVFLNLYFAFFVMNDYISNDPIFKPQIYSRKKYQ